MAVGDGALGSRVLRALTVSVRSICQRCSLCLLPSEGGDTIGRVKADKWISVRVDEQTLRRLNELGARFGSRSQFVMFALRIASGLADPGCVVGGNAIAPRSVSDLLQNERDPAGKPGRAETSVLGREEVGQA
jgi:hypothetical protein